MSTVTASSRRQAPPPSNVPAGRRRAARLRTPRAQAALALGLYLAIALAITWPWATDPGDYLYGVPFGDQTSSVAMMDQYADERHPPFLPGEISRLNAPDGYEVHWAMHLASVGSSSVLWVLSLAFGAVAAHGLVAVAGFVLSAFAMFLLVRRITGSAGAALVAGLAFGFWPHMYETGWTWPHYISLWVLVILCWRMLVLAEEPAVRNGLWAGAAALLAMTWIEYHLLIGSVLFATLAVCVAAVWWRQGRLRRGAPALAASLAVVGVAVAAILVAALASDLEGAPNRGADEAVTLSARPLMYVVPGKRHPILGGSAGEWITEKYDGIPVGSSPTANYAAIYLGVFTVLLALAGIVLSARRLRARRRAAEAATAAAALVVAIVGLAFSAPPKAEIAGVLVPLPYTFVNEVTPVFRVAGRFSTVVMLGACVLAGIAVAALLRRLGGRGRVAAVALLGALVLVDGYSRPEPGTSRIPVPPIYRELARQPDGIVAVYPMPAPDVALNRHSLYQEVHEHPLFNGWDHADPTSVTRKETVRDLQAPGAIRLLAAFGVEYVVVVNGVVRWDEGRPRARAAGLEPVADAGLDRLYRVTARPPSAYALPLEGWHRPEGEAPYSRWMAASPARLELGASCDRCEGILRFEATPFGGAHELTIRDEAGRELLREAIATPYQKVSVRLPLRRRTVVTLTTDPPPRQVSKTVPGSPDTREVSIAAGRIELELVR